MHAFAGSVESELGTGTTPKMAGAASCKASELSRLRRGSEEGRRSSSHSFHSSEQYVSGLLCDQKIVKKTKQPIRLYAKGIILGSSSAQGTPKGLEASESRNAEATSAAGPIATPIAPF